MQRLTKRIYSVGVNDTDKVLFEGLWPLPYGVSYNSYLVVDEKIALIDTVESGFEEDFLYNIREAIGDRPVDYLVVNHMEPDHSSLISYMMERYPELLIVANAKTVPMLKGYYGVAEEDVLVMPEGGELSLGTCALKFHMIPMVHWPETMVTYDTTDQILFSCDAFGSFGTLDGGIFDDTVNFDFYEEDMRRYYSNIVGKWSNMVQKAFAKLDGVPVKIICPSHGIIWRKDPSKVLSLYDKWSKHEAEEGVVIIYASMYGNTEKFAEEIARKISEQGVRDIRVFDVSKTHVSYLLSAIWKYKGLILGSCAYNTDMHPMMALLTHEISVSDPKNKVLGIFGGSSWNSSGSKALRAFAEKMKMDVVGDNAEFLGRPFASDMEQLDAFAKEFVAQLRK